MTDYDTITASGLGSEAVGGIGTDETVTANPELKKMKQN
jgi:hypothetical protein